MNTKENKISIVYYSGGSYSSFVLNHLGKLKPTNFIVFDFEVLPTVDFEKELGGETKIFKELSSVSKKLDAYVIALASIETEEKKAKAALVLENGKLLSICEQICEKEKTGGNSISFFDTPFGRLGVFVLENAAQVEFYQLAAAYEADIVFAFPKTDSASKRLSALCAGYASERYSLNIVCFYKKQIKAFCKKNKSTSCSKLIFLSGGLKNRAKNKKFLKHIHKSIYSKLS